MNRFTSLLLICLLICILKVSSVLSTPTATDSSKLHPTQTLPTIPAAESLDGAINHEPVVPDAGGDADLPTVMTTSDLPPLKPHAPVRPVTTIPTEESMADSRVTTSAANSPSPDSTTKSTELTGGITNREKSEKDAPSKESHPIVNDPTTHISYSEDNTEETHCTRTGACSECSGREQSESFCQLNGFKELVNCQVLSTNSNHTALTVQEEKANLLRSFTQFTNCEGQLRATSFWVFQACCLIGVGLSGWLLLKRRRVVLSAHHRRLDRLVNS